MPATWPPRRGPAIAGVVASLLNRLSPRGRPGYVEEAGIRESGLDPGGLGELVAVSREGVAIETDQDAVREGLIARVGRQRGRNTWIGEVGEPADGE